MTSPNPYAWLGIAAIQAFRANNPDPKPTYLTLITANSTPPKTRKPKMKATPDQATKKAEIALELDDLS